MAVVQGWAETRMTLVAWNLSPFAVLGRWLRVSLGVALALLVAVFLLPQLRRRAARPSVHPLSAEATEPPIPRG